MLEIPEARVITNQLNSSVKGKRIKDAVAAFTPHKLAWFTGDPAEYSAKLTGRAIINSHAYAGRIEIETVNYSLSFLDGAVLRYYKDGEQIPPKHQLRLTLEDNSNLIVTIAMYGGILLIKPEDMSDDFYYNAAKSAVSPLSNDFTREYFNSLFNEKSLKMSAKAFLATEQRIPGLGNGVLQDILFNAKIHPKRKVNTLSDNEINSMYESVKSTLSEMVAGNGRDTERDLFGNPGGYITKVSKKTVSTPCLICGSEIKKEAYMGGSIYYCPGCQVL